MTERFFFISFRILLGGFLAWHWLTLREFMHPLFSAQGMYTQRFALPFPNALSLDFVQAHLLWFNAAMIAAALSFAVGLSRLIAGVVLWWGHATCTSWNAIVAPPSDGYVGWLLLAVVCVPLGEGGGMHRRRSDWVLPKELCVVGIVVLSLTYTLSGLDKLRSVLWTSGDALQHVFLSPIVRDNILTWWLQRQPELFVRILSWGSVAAEIACLPLLPFAYGRMVAWLSMMLLHVGILVTLSITNVTLAMIAFHLFVMPCVFPSFFRAKCVKGHL